jgi:hypothetical protein
MSDSYTEVTSESWFSRLGNAIKGVVLGLILFVVAFPLLWWNEGRAVKTAKGLKEAGGAVVSVAADKVNPDQDKQLVHLTAKATTEETLSDPDFKFSAPAIKLRRRVEMYQWKENEKTEERKKLGGGVEKTKTWTYDKTWSADLISSQGFKHRDGHENPESQRFVTHQETAKDVKAGAYQLSPGLIGQISNFQPLTVDAEALEQVPEELRKQIQPNGNKLYLRNDPQQWNADSAKPEIGDLRLTFDVAKPSQISLLARQFGNTFEPWVSHTGTQIEQLTEGEVSAENMLGQLERQNTMMTWILRGAGFLCMAFGIGLVMSPLAVMADVLPLLGDLLRMGLGLFAGVVAGTLSLVTIAIAWVVYRPLLGVGLLVLAGLLAWFFLRLAAKRRATAG